MTNINDHKHNQQLNAWLDAYQVDTSASRLAQLENSIMNHINPTPTSWGWLPTITLDEALSAFSAASVIVLTLLFTAVQQEQTPPTYISYYVSTNYALWSQE